MNDVTSLLPDPADCGEPKGKSRDLAGRGHGLSAIFWLVEQPWAILLSIPTVVAAAVTLIAKGSPLLFASSWIGVPLLGVGIPTALIIYGSRRRGKEPADWTPYLRFRDAVEAERWSGKKIPMEVLYEAYLAQRVSFVGDVREALLRRNQIFRFCFTPGDAKYFLLQFIEKKLGHGLRADRLDIAPNYDRGNDFYRAFLGDTMVYTCGLFRNPDESLEAAQRRKLQTVCQYVQMKPGDRHLDVGCGWGALLTHAASVHGTESTGVTLSREQGEWATRLASEAGVSHRVRVLVDDYRNLPDDTYDKITCLEMAEHVGIRNFQKFLLRMRALLKDDGVFYLQIAGLRREWQYEDLVWGLFMAKYIFPGADASCPLAFVVSQVERAGFEVHRVENCGAHYSVTIQKWYENWMRNEAGIVAKYGERWFRLWRFFLGWSGIIAAQGTSTVFMITLTKNTANDRSSVTEEEAKGVAYSRRERWIGPNVVATQQ
jgi:cyclopropane fatty-acyl-phospholipid synthase-like methyltransferase